MPSIVLQPNKANGYAGGVSRVRKPRFKIRVAATSDRLLNKSRRPLPPPKGRMRGWKAPAVGGGWICLVNVGKSGVFTDKTHLDRPQMCIRSRSAYAPLRFLERYLDVCFFEDLMLVTFDKMKSFRILYV